MAPGAREAIGPAPKGAPFSGKGALGRGKPCSGAQPRGRGTLVLQNWIVTVLGCPESLVLRPACGSQGCPALQGSALGAMLTLGWSRTAWPARSPAPTLKCCSSLSLLSWKPEPWTGGQVLGFSSSLWFPTQVTKTTNERETRLLSCSREGLDPQSPQASPAPTTAAMGPFRSEQAGTAKAEALNGPVHPQR